MKFLRLVLFLAVLAVTTSARAEEENKYDLVSRVLMPFLNVFVETTTQPNRAFQLTGKLELLTDAPPALIGSRAELAVQYPDRMKLHAPVLGEDLTICRRGDEIWVYPGSKAEALMKAAAQTKKLPKADKKFKLAPFSLPIPEQNLQLLPVLLQVKDVGSEPLDGQPCRVMDLYLMPELGKALKIKDWAARVWARPDGKPGRLALSRDKWNIVIRFENVQFAPKLPDSTWEPTPEQAGDILKLDPVKYQQLLNSFGQ